jgi:large subunit ribosomal protein L28
LADHLAVRPLLAEIGASQMPSYGEIVVAAVCEICGKSPGFGMSVSHSHRRTKRRWNPNIQRVRAVVDGTPKRISVCTSCIRAGKITKPVRRTPSPAESS